MKQEMMGWQWHQLDHMQIIYTSLWKDNDASTSPLRFITKFVEKLYSIMNFVKLEEATKICINLLCSEIRKFPILT